MTETMSPVAKDDPLMIAWEAYKDTPDYTNALRWASKPEHSEGSLWAAFMAGFNATTRTLGDHHDD